MKYLTNSMICITKVYVLLIVLLYGNIGESAEPLYSFKGVFLGMTTDEFKSVPFLTASSLDKYRKPQVGCLGTSGEFKGFLGNLESDTSKQLKELGGDSCSYNDSVLFFKMLSLSYGFYFIKMDQDTSAKLFNMWFKISVKDYDELLFELTKKYGKPKITKETIKNRMNARFDNQISVWENSLNKITLIKHHDSIEYSFLDFSLKKHSDFFNKKLKELRLKSPSKI